MCRVGGTDFGIIPKKKVFLGLLPYLVIKFANNVSWRLCGEPLRVGWGGRSPLRRSVTWILQKYPRVCYIPRTRSQYCCRSCRTIGQILHIPNEERSKNCERMDCGGTTQDEELLKRGKLEMQRSSSNVEDGAHEEILRSERHWQRRRSSTVGSGNAEEDVRKSSTAENPPWGEMQQKTLNLERMTNIQGWLWTTWKRL